MFYDRQEAGQLLAGKLGRFKDRGAVVFGLPRGGVVVAGVVAKELHAPLEILVTRKLAHPWSPEYAIGAIAEHIEPIWNPAEKQRTDPKWQAYELEEQRREIRRRLHKYVGGHKPVGVHGRVGIIVDDGVATGLTMLAAIEELREQDPAQIVVAVPVAPLETVAALRETADSVVVLKQPKFFRGGVGAYYQNFEQTTDREVMQILKAARSGD